MNYWSFVKKIFENPADHLLRMVFADWLDDQDMVKAAKTQRHNAGLIQNVYKISKVYGKFYGFMRTKKGVKVFEIKRDGQIVFLAVDWFAFSRIEKIIFLRRNHVPKRNESNAT